MEPWYKIAVPRKEVREGRSFNPDEFAIALEQVVAKTAPEDYRDPKQFFARTVFTRALREHSALVLRRLDGKTENAAPVLTLITQFGGGKTHTLTTLYHLATNGDKASSFAGVSDLVKAADLSAVPKARVAVFVGNAWDPTDGSETPWIDVARQLAGDRGVEALGKAALTTPPGTEALARVFQAAQAPVLILCDEVLNFVNRYRGMAEQFYAFVQNLTVAMTGTSASAAVISLPRSQVEMTDWDLQWQDRISKVVRRVAKDLIVNDEAEISEVVRRRLFENLGSERGRKSIANTFADWCFERRAQLPAEWTAVDTAITEAKAKDFLRARFEASYPFHPATLSVFQRKWQSLQQYQQTRGTLAMLAQWISVASKESFTKARTEPLITLGSAPLFDPNFLSVVLGQLGESRLVAAIDTDIAGANSHAKALDADTKGPLRDIHRRVGTAILFESSGGQTDKTAHFPELRFALGEPSLDTTSIDNAAVALESKSYFMRKVGADGFKIGYQPTLKKVVNDRRASLDEESEVKPTVKKLVEDEFRRQANIPIVPFPKDGSEIPDTPKLTIVIADPDAEWIEAGALRQQIAEWTKQRGKSPRLYPAALVWCIRKPGRDLREKVEQWLAWKRVDREIRDGTLGGEFDRTELADIRSTVTDAEGAAKDEVLAGYRFAIVAGGQDGDGLETIDLGAGHSSSGETLCARVISALKSRALLNDSVGAGYIDRNWPPALRESGAWPLASLRQSFLNGSLTRLLDPDIVLRGKIVEFVARGDFGLASGQRNGSGYDRVWFQETVGADEVSFEPGVFLLKKSVAQSLKQGTPIAQPSAEVAAEPSPIPQPSPIPEATSSRNNQTRTIRITGTVPPELWNRLGTKILPKLRTGSALKAGIDLEVTVDPAMARNLVSDLRQILNELGVNDQLAVREI
jgi:hypothetical protein